MSILEAGRKLQCSQSSSVFCLFFLLALNGPVQPLFNLGDVSNWQSSHDLFCHLHGFMVVSLYHSVETQADGFVLEVRHLLRDGTRGRRVFLEHFSIGEFFFWICLFSQNASFLEKMNFFEFLNFFFFFLVLNKNFVSRNRFDRNWRRKSSQTNGKSTQ